MTWQESPRTSTFLKPLLQPHEAPSPLPQGSELHHRAGPKLNPWEGPRSGSLCTPTQLAYVHETYSQLGPLPVRGKGIPSNQQLYFCLYWEKNSRPGHKTHHPTDWVSSKILHFDLSQKAEDRFSLYSPMLIPSFFCCKWPTIHGNKAIRNFTQCPTH